MTGNRNMNAKFRAALRNELTIWTQDGIVSEEAAGRLSKDYQLGHLREESSRQLSAVIFILGGLLLGGGLISFVAANWEYISTPVKLALLFSLMLGFHITGYWLWRAGNWRRLGHALIFCGCLVFGANIGLIAQIFHISGEWYGAFGAWAIGSLVMAWAIRSWIIGALALCTSFLWFFGFQQDHERAALLYPLALAAFLIPLAWAVRSRVLYAGTLLAIAITTAVLANYDGSPRQVLLSMAASGLFIWTLGELHRVTGRRGEFADVTAGLGLSFLAMTAYIWSFHDIWDLSGSYRDAPPGPAFLFVLLPVLLLVLSIAASLLLLRKEREARRQLIIGVLIAGALLCGSSLLANAGAPYRNSLLTIAVNVAALLVAAVAIGTSLIEERRVIFWLGTLYVVLLILSRFLEYETSLLLKSAAFLACGVAVILGGISYERYLRRKDAPLEGDKGKEVAYE